MPKAEVLLQILVVTLDAPALMGGAHELVDGRVCWQRGQEVLAWLFVIGGPLDEQPLLRTQACLTDIATGMAHPYGFEALT